MTGSTLLFRQVHPTWFQEGRVTSQVFKPTAKDNNRLSVYNGDIISAQDSWKHWTAELKFNSIGVLAITVNECNGQELVVEFDGNPFPEHASIQFDGLSNKQKETKAKYLHKFALDRGWQYRASYPETLVV